MSCNSCSTDKGGQPRGCKNNGTCGTDSCNKLTVFDWLANMSLPEGQEAFIGVEVRFKNGLPVTSKGDTANHGFGVRSIRSVAGKYGGTVHIKNEDGLFILTVLLPVQ